jgi:hypothetical protein
LLCWCSCLLPPCCLASKTRSICKSTPLFLTPQQHPHSIDYLLQVNGPIRNLGIHPPPLHPRHQHLPRPDAPLPPRRRNDRYPPYQRTTPTPRPDSPECASASWISWLRYSSTLLALVNPSLQCAETHLCVSHVAQGISVFV